MMVCSHSAAPQPQSWSPHSCLVAGDGLLEYEEYLTLLDTPLPSVAPLAKKLQTAAGERDARSRQGLEPTHGRAFEKTLQSAALTLAAKQRDSDV